jgi:thiamine biosynthesis lipoprotein
MSVSPIFHHVFAAMHTRFSVVLPGIAALAGESLARELEALVWSRERLMSRFDPDGPLADLNRRAASEAVEPPALLWEILRTCASHWERTSGAFDIAQTARTELWRRAAARRAAPSASELADAARQSGFQHVQFDTAAGTVRFAVPGLELDLGGIGKGLALEECAALLRGRGVECAFLSFGESSVAVIGAHPAGPFWPVAVADLFQPARSWHRFELRDAAMSTSGNRATHAHVVNPRDGQLITGCRTLSVACPSAVDAEVLSTALLVTPASERTGVLQNYPEIRAVEIVYECENGGWAGSVAWQHAS